MKVMIKQFTKSLINSCIPIIRQVSIGRYFYDQVVRSSVEETVKISHNSSKLALTLSVPNQLCRFRAETFSTKEPETLEWIDSFSEGSILWDIGANIGLYSIYAAKQKNCQVWAFEPSVFNLEFLARNVFLNGVAEKICLVPLALNKQLGPNSMNMSSTEWGGALSTFGQDYGWDGKKLQQVFAFQTLGVSMEDAVQLLKIPQPDYIKMDVDGIEQLILQGGMSVITQVKGILIEVNDDFHEQADQCQKLLNDAGLVLKEKRHGELLDGTSAFSSIYNQIWVRP